MIKRWVIFTFYAASLVQLGPTRNYKAAEEKYVKHLNLETGVVQVSRNIVTVLYIHQKINKQRDAPSCGKVVAYRFRRIFRDQNKHSDYCC